jgi:signal transduction histidine kinase
MSDEKHRFENILFKACIDSANDMIILAIDLQFNYLAFNAYHSDIMLKAYGKKIKLGMNLLDCITNSEDLKKSKINYDRALAGEGHKTVEEYGEFDRQYFETRYNPIYNESNEIIGATAFSANVTVRRQMEKSLSESERFLRESQSVARLGTFVWEMSDGLWRSSKIMDEIFGIDDKYNRSFEGWGKLIHPKWKGIMLDYVNNEVLGKHQRFDKDYKIVRQSDKKLRWVHGLAELELDEHDRPVRLIGTISDITERKLVEDKLIIQSKALEKELANRKKAEIVLQKSHKQLEINKLATLNLLEDIKLEMHQRKKAEEEVRIINAVLEKRVAERTAQLESANKELESFAYSVSHDLRAPLRAIMGFSKFVIDEYSQNIDNEGARLLGLIQSNTQKMDQLIIDILALSRVSRNTLKKSKVDMAKMAMSMLNEVASPETQKNINIIVEKLPDAFADSTYLKQVWINLISNAIKFSSKKGKPEIEIGGYTDEGSNVYFVRDNGVGFKPDYGHKLFGVFQRLHKSDEFEGNGVGLAIVQRIIHRHEGKVWAEGKSGEGATFFFSLPVIS